MSENINLMGVTSGRYIDENNRISNIIDPISEGFTVVSTDHRYIHDGIMYEASQRLSMASGATVQLQIKTPTIGYVHYRSENITTNGSELNVDFYEGSSTASATGVATVLSVNRSRVSTATATLTFKNCGTAVSTGIGTAISVSTLCGGSGSAGLRIGVAGVQANEIVLAQDTWYTISLKNMHTASATVTYNALWYEEERG